MCHPNVDILSVEGRDGDRESMPKMTLLKISFGSTQFPIYQVWFLVKFLDYVLVWHRKKSMDLECEVWVNSHLVTVSVKPWPQY